MNMAEYYIGTSGWHYEHWRELFYPEKLAKPNWLEFYAQHFNTVELNNSFYRLPSEKAFINWRESSSGGFVFAVKVSRFITHIKRLKDVEESVQNFLARADSLQDKFGPLLYQLPPTMKRSDETLETFLSILPRQYRHVFEFRHESWLDDDVFNILKRYGVGLCVFDMPDFTCPVLATADFAYVRFHGSTGLYWSCYNDEELSSWARKIAEIGKNLRAVYIYFNNDAGAYAIRNAKTLAMFLAEK